MLNYVYYIFLFYENAYNFAVLSVTYV